MANYIALNNGQLIPKIGLGTYKLKNPEKTVKEALDVGYRLIDTAFYYQNEIQLGRGIKAKIDEGGIKREDIFVISKLWNTSHQPEKVEPAIKKSLSDLGLEYVDLYLMHWPFACKDAENPYTINLEEDDVPPEETWKAMEKCVKAGYAKSIGLSNFNSKQIERILNIAEIKPVVNEVECNLYCNQRKLIQFCNERDIVIMSYCPFWQGGFTGSDELKGLEEDVVKEIAKIHNKTPGQIVLRYLIQLGTVPIPKTDRIERLKENFDVFSFHLSEEEVEKLHQLHKNIRYVNYTPAKNFKEYPFSIEY